VIPTLLLWLATPVAPPEAALLGHERFEVREAASQRIKSLPDSKLLPLLRHPDPEVRHRAKRLATGLRQRQADYVADTLARWPRPPYLDFLWWDEKDKSYSKKDPLAVWGKARFEKYCNVQPIVNLWPGDNFVNYRAGTQMMVHELMTKDGWPAWAVHLLLAEMRRREKIMEKLHPTVYQPAP
jgi:hypothetical protein